MSKEKQTREKQIEEMAVDLCRIDLCKHLEEEQCDATTCVHCSAEALYNAGYRKQSDTAREIFGALENLFGKATEVSALQQIFETAEYTKLKNKYTGG